MRILHLTPGTGNFHCGSCLRDHALIKALRVRGHDALMAPLYLPLVTDREFGSQELPIQIGGISLFLQQKISWFHKLPRFFHNWINKPVFLRLASSRMGMTSAKLLGDMALGALLGTSGRQWGEWERLIQWVRTQGKFDVISLSNSLLTGLAPTLEKELGVPVVCSIQGEDSFLDTLPEPYRAQCWEAMRRNARSIRCFIAPSQFYADSMRERLDVPATQMKVLPNGIDTTAFTTSSPDPNWPTIGYFARMIHGKGLTTLVDAFIDLAKRGSVPRVRLRIGGAKTPVDEKYVAGLQSKIQAAGLTKRVEWLPNLTFKDKVHFFHDLTVFSVPATYGEAFGLYVIEAVSSGVPVIQPDHGAFPELIAATDGGMLCKPDDAKALADALESLLNDDELREKFSKNGINKVRQEFSATRMAERFETILQELSPRPEAILTPHSSFPVLTPPVSPSNVRPPMTSISFGEAVRRSIQKDPRYHPAAYELVRDALHVAAKKFRDENAEDQHVSGQELLAGFRDYVLSEYGPMSTIVLGQWGLQRGEDVGNIVYNLIDCGYFGKNDGDSLDDFAGGYHFEIAFTTPFLPASLRAEREKKSS